MTPHPLLTGNFTHFSIGKRTPKGMELRVYVQLYFEGVDPCACPRGTDDGRQWIRVVVVDAKPYPWDMQS